MMYISYRIASQPILTLTDLLFAECHFNQLSVVLIHCLEFLSVQVKVRKVFTGI